MDDFGKTFVFLAIVVVAGKFLQMAKKGRRSASKRAKSGASTAHARATPAMAGDDRLALPIKPRRIIVPRSAPIASPDTPTLDTIGWENFELLVAEMFRRKGYIVEITSGLGADGGKDVVLRKGDDLEVVQCKNLARDNRVTASQMRDFFGLITAERAVKGWFVTTGYFSADAKRFAAGKPIELLERGDIEQFLGVVATAGENLCDVSSWIDTFAAHVHVVDPVCPFCEQPMKLRRGALGRPFWGCTRYATHRCKGVRDGREELLKARQWQSS